MLKKINLYVSIFEDRYRQRETDVDPSPKSDDKVILKKKTCVPPSCFPRAIGSRANGLSVRNKLAPKTR